MSTNPRKRSLGMKISLTPSLHADLVEVATAIGQTPATAASFAIGQWVAQQKRHLSATEMAVNAMAEQVGPEFARQISLLGQGGK
jgi:hypothetical protein